MKKNKNPKNLLVKSLYPGGQVAMDKFVREQMKYPQSGLEEKIEGDVDLEYRIGSHGKVLDAKVVKGINADFNEEAMRIVKLFRFTAQTNKKLKVFQNMKITIHFRMPKQQQAKKKSPEKTDLNLPPGEKPRLKYNYEYVAAKKTKVAGGEPKAKPRVYQYTVKKR